MTHEARCKKYLSHFISEAKQISLYAAEDLIDECQRICNEVRFENNKLYKNIEEVILDYLSLGEDYAFIFKDSNPCEDCVKCDLDPLACVNCKIGEKQNDYTKAKQLYRCRHRTSL